jgi:hypothetical protein
MFWTFLIWILVLVKVIGLPRSSGTWGETLLATAVLAPFYLGPLFIMWMFARRSFEEETICLDKVTLSIEKRMLWWKRLTSTPLIEINNLRIIKRWPDNLVRDLAFDCHGRTYHFGTRILRDEAQELLNLLNGYLPRCNALQDHNVGFEEHS